MSLDRYIAGVTAVPKDPVIDLLDELIATADRSGIFESAISEARLQLSANPDLRAASVNVPLDIFGPSFPSDIRSCRVFVLRANAEFEVERHPNSFQRVLSLRGGGEIRVMGGEHETTIPLRSNPNTDAEARWCSVGPGIWHQPAAGASEWVVLAFHTASEADLIDEYQRAAI